MEPFETFEHAGCVIELHWDTDPTSPADWDTLGEMVSTSRFQRRYGFCERTADGTEEDALERGGVALLARYLRMTEGATIVPFHVHEHGTCALFAGDISDDECDGFIVTTPARCAELGVDPADAESGLRAELGTWGAYVSGDVAGYVVKGENGEVVDSCWGFYPDAPDPTDPLKGGRYFDPWEYVRQEARESADHEQHERERAANQDVATR